MKKKQPQRVKPVLVGSRLFFQAWRDAAAEWRRLQSGAAEARCRVARRDYYLHLWGEVPALAVAE